ncbi:Bacterial extracellular solute-binding protein, family 7 [anaerobic digester metagenome]
MKAKGIVTVVLVMALFCAASAQAARVLKFGHIAPTQIDNKPFPMHRAALAFAEHVEKETKGEIKIEVFPLGQLGNERSMLEQVQFGTLDMMDCTTAVMSNLIPQVGLLDLFFLFPSKEVAYKVLADEEFKTVMDALMPQMGLMPIGYAENEMRDFGVRDRTITSPEQMKGVRVRVMDSPVFLDSFRALGANPVGIPFPELYTALQQGAVDMQENPIPTSVMMKFTEVAKFLTRSSHSLTCLYKMVSLPVWESLTPEQQKIFVDAARIAEDINRSENTKMRAELEQLAKDKFGATIAELTPEQRVAFHDAVLPVHEKFAEQAGTIPNDPKFGKWAGKRYYDMIVAKVSEYGK